MKYYLTLFVLLLAFTGNSAASVADQSFPGSKFFCADDDKDEDKEPTTSGEEEEEPDCE